MHPFQVLAEIIQARPNLVSLRAVLDWAAETSIMAVLRSDVVHALLMPLQIIRRTEAFLPSTPGFIAFEWFLMSANMLSRRPIRQHGCAPGA